MNAAYKGIEKIKFVGLIISGAAISLMMILIALDVLLRTVFQLPTVGSYEIAQYFLMPLAFFPGLAYVYSSGIMPRLEMLVQKFKDRQQYIISIALVSLELILFLMLTIFAFQYAWVGFVEGVAFSMKGAVIPYYPVLFVIPAGFLLLTIEIFFVLLRNIQTKTAQLHISVNNAKEPPSM
ncbi:TRAP transporter small permease [Geomicrobium sediminis]|uniref:TRAP-type C4-dicarboxylate transport system permease small subunit n=1 Tax=Geomicrobium sediminis TaxID=1347788 RepID=A0ABS2PCN9_9BACL|nr:TRAP transporter small permease subunit [Geomicrobium sediminis]MBM7633199.1 TRAP-type C4-dicarboxylate transport system permease small subunit [Geomicrobium sediminis]